MALKFMVDEKAETTFGSNPRKMDEFGESMKSNSLNSLGAVLESGGFSDTRKVADIGGGFGHLAVALLEKYPRLTAVVLDMPDVIPMSCWCFFRARREPGSNGNRCTRQRDFESRGLRPSTITRIVEGVKL
jgi:O-methyltransferase domain